MRQWVLRSGGRFLLAHGDLCLAAGLAAAGAYFFSGWFTPVRFDRERIEIRAASGQIQVTGLYHYTNQSRLPAVLTLRLPFPVDAAHPRPDAYFLCESDAEGRCTAEIPATARGEDVRFRLRFAPHARQWVRIDYVQPTRVENGRYLLTTTRPWRRPIERADYVLRLAPDVRLAASSYPLREAGPQGANRVYEFSRTDFFPGQDWVFAWRARTLEAADPGGGAR